MLDQLPATIVLLITLGAFVIIGLAPRSRADDVEDYVVARNSQSAMTLGLSFFASGMGAWILFAPPEVGAFVGLVGVIGYALGAAGPILAFALIGRRLRRLAPMGHGLTEFVRLRFGRLFHGYVVGISALYMLFFVTAELTAVGGLSAILSGADPRVAVVAVAVATLAYTTYGGLRASLSTDRWQAWLAFALIVAGGAVLTRLPTTGGDLGLRDVTGGGFQVAVTLIIAVTTANLFHHGYWQRVWAASDQRSLDRGALVGAGSSLAVVAFVGFLGMRAAELGLPLGEPPVPFFALLAAMPSWVGLLVLVLGVALVASSVDTLENGLAALVTSEAPRRATLSTARIVTVVLMIPAVAIALQGYSVLRLFLIADLLCAATAVPALLGLWSRATGRGALAGAVAGLVGAVLGGWVASGSLVDGVLAATFPGGAPTLPPFAGAVLASTLVALAVDLASGQRTDLTAIGPRIRALGQPGVES